MHSHRFIDSKFFTLASGTFKLLPPRPPHCANIFININIYLYFILVAVRTYEYSIAEVSPPEMETPLAAAAVEVTGRGEAIMKLNRHQL